MGGKHQGKEAISVSEDTDHFDIGHPPAAGSNWFE